MNAEAGQHPVLQQRVRLSAKAAPLMNEKRRWLARSSAFAPRRRHHVFIAKHGSNPTPVIRTENRCESPAVISSSG